MTATPSLSSAWRTHAVVPYGPEGRYAALYDNVAGALGYDLRDLGFIETAPRLRAPVLAVGPDLTQPLRSFADDALGKDTHILLSVAQRGWTEMTLATGSLTDAYLEISAKDSMFMVREIGRGADATVKREVAPADLAAEVDHFIAKNAGDDLKPLVDAAIAQAKKLPAIKTPASVLAL